MTTDLVVVVPGVMGSSLADAEGHEVWGVGARGISDALRTLGGSIRDLTLPDDQGDGPAPDGVTSTGLIAGLHVIPGIWSPIDGYGRLEEFLQRPRFGLRLDRPEVRDAPPGNLVLFSYDWRLSNRWTASGLKTRVETALARWRESAPARRGAKVVFICHSMGGLVARWYLDRCGGAAITRALITLGTPHRGSLNALVQLVNGVRKGIGPVKLDLTSFGRSLPSSYQLLPEYACIEDGTDELRKTTEIELPKLAPGMVKDGMLFHEQLDACEPASYSLIPVVGIGQPTWTTARIAGDGVEPAWSIHGKDRAGDGTVPRDAARPKRLKETDGSIRDAGEGHGALAIHRSILRQLDFVLTAEAVDYRDVGSVTEDRVTGVTVPALHVPGEEIAVQVRIAQPRRLEVNAFDERRRQVGRQLVRFRGGDIDREGRTIDSAVLGPFEPGGYTLVVGAPDDPQGAEVPHVRQTTLIWAD